MTEKGLVMRGHPGGGLGTEMDPRDVVRDVRLYMNMVLLYASELRVSALLTYLSPKTVSELLLRWFELFKIRFFTFS